MILIKLLSGAVIGGLAAFVISYTFSLSSFEIFISSLFGVGLGFILIGMQLVAPLGEEA